MLAGGTLELIAGASQSATTIASGGILEIGAGATLSGFQVMAGVIVEAASGGVLTSTAVKNGGLEIVFAGGSAGGVVSSGGALELVGSNPDAGGVTFGKGSIREIGSGYTFVGGTVGSGLVVKILSGGSASGTTISSGGVEFVSARGVAIDAVVGSDGTLLVASGGTAVGVAAIGSGALVETTAGGTAVVSGTITNSGTLFASGALSLVDVLSGATVTGGGIAKIGNGIVDIAGPGDNQNVVFQSGGTGGLDIGVLGSAYAGIVSGFGQNVHQFIDFTAINAASATFSYTSASSSSGVLTVANGGTSASIDLSGHYTSASFHISAGSGGTVEIIDPPLPHQQIGFGPDTPACLGNIIEIGRQTIANDLLIGKIALLCNYIAAGFPATANGHGGTLATEMPLTDQQPMLTHPHAQ